MFKATDSGKTADSSENGGSTKLQEGRLKKFKRKIIDGSNRSVNRKPVYTITENGIKKEYFDFNDKENLPFDIDTFKDCQIFLGDYANPWSIDFDAIEEEYSEYSYGDPLDDLIEENHVIPSQKYKTFMNQYVLQSTFSVGGIEFEKMKYMLYGIAGVVIFDLLMGLS